MHLPDTLKLVVAEEDAPEAIAFVLKKDSPEVHVLKSMTFQNFCSRGTHSQKYSPLGLYPANVLGH
jgi:hypothetical protein